MRTEWSKLKFSLTLTCTWTYGYRYFTTRYLWRRRSTKWFRKPWTYTSWISSLSFLLIWRAAAKMSHYGSATFDNRCWSCVVLQIQVMKRVSERSVTSTFLSKDIGQKTQLLSMRWQNLCFNPFDLQTVRTARYKVYLYVCWHGLYSSGTIQPSRLQNRIFLFWPYLNLPLQHRKTALWYTII